MGGLSPSADAAVLSSVLLEVLDEVYGLELHWARVFGSGPREVHTRASLGRRHTHEVDSQLTQCNCRAYRACLTREITNLE